MALGTISRFTRPVALRARREKLPARLAHLLVFDAVVGEGLRQGQAGRMSPERFKLGVNLPRKLTFFGAHQARIPLLIGRQGRLRQVGAADDDAAQAAAPKNVPFGVKARLAGRLIDAEKLHLNVLEGGEFFEGLGLGELKIVARENSPGHAFFLQFLQHEQQRRDAAAGHEGHAEVKALALLQLLFQNAHHLGAARGGVGQKAHAQGRVGVKGVVHKRARKGFGQGVVRSRIGHGCSEGGGECSAA